MCDKNIDRLSKSPLNSLYHGVYVKVRVNDDFSQQVFAMFNICLKIIRIFVCEFVMSTLAIFFALGNTYSRS